MDLKNGNILIRQLEANPKAKELMLREFPMLSSQLIRLARNMTRLARNMTAIKIKARC